MDTMSNFEHILQLGGVLAHNETIFDLLKKPYGECKSLIDNYHNSQKPKLSEFGKFVNRVIASEGFYQAETNSDDYKVKINASRIRKELLPEIVEILSPWIILFFKWDLERRVWSEDGEGYKLRYIREIVNELSLELDGNTDVILEKYTLIMLDFMLHLTEKIDPKIMEQILASRPEHEINQYNEGIYFIRKHRNDMSENIAEKRDNETIKAFLKKYKQAATQLTRGLFITGGRYDYLFQSFIEAQVRYKSFLEQQLEILETKVPVNRLRKNLKNLDIESFINEIRAIFASVPNEITKNTNEAFYHIFIHLILKLVGCKVISENSTSLGRIDAVIETKNHIYILEFKMGTAEEAINQIIEKKYYESFINREKPINLIGIAFCKETRNIKDYKFILDYTE